MRRTATVKRVRIFCRGGWKQKENRNEGENWIKFFVARALLLHVWKSCADLFLSLPLEIDRVFG